jgi:hypothetical protein
MTTMVFSAGGVASSAEPQERALRPAQFADPVRQPADAIRVRVETLHDHITVLAGHHVEVRGARVGRVLGPELFTLRSWWWGEWTEVVVFVPGGMPELRTDGRVVVSGLARTLLEAQVQHGPRLDERLLRARDRWAVVEATSVRTPGGVELIRTFR